MSTSEWEDEVGEGEAEPAEVEGDTGEEGDDWVEIGELEEESASENGDEGAFVGG